MEVKSEEALFNYINFNKHKKQIEFHQNPARNKWIFGGNRTGKTECGAVETVMFATGEHPFREIKGATEGWVVSLTARMSRDIAQAKILKYLAPDKIIEVVMQKGRKGSPEFGLKVIPSVQCGDERSFEFCFDGIEEGSVVAVSTFWKNDKDAFMRGYNKMLEVIKLSAIICYDKPFPEMKGNIKVCHRKCEQCEWKDKLSPVEQINKYFEKCCI